MSNPIPLPPFKAFLASNIPSVYDNTLSYYDELTKLIAYMEELVPAVNENTAGLAALKDYVEHYFDNLNVQEEINNKLDEMAEGGQLATIIAQFLEVAPVFAYGTIAEMAAATNLNDGTIARVLGNTTASAGDGAFYMIRTRTGADDPDGLNLVAIGDSLVGVRVQDAAINAVNARIDNLANERTILIGDSYSVYRPDTEGIEGWAVPLKRLLGLSDANCYTLQDNGGGFIAQGSLGTFQNALVNATIANKNTIKRIVVCAGINDFNSTTAQIKTAISNFIDYCKLNYPNAQVYLGMISWDNDEQYTVDNQFSRYKLLNNVLPAYQEAQEFGAIYLNGVENVMHDYSNYYDRTHPNETLCLKLAQYIYNALKNGYASVSYPLHRIQLLNANIVDGNTRIYEQIINNQTVLYSNIETGVVVEYSSNYPTTSQNSFYFGNMDSNYLRCVNLNDPLCTCPAIITDTNNQTYEVTLTLYIKNWSYVHAHFASTEIQDGLSIKSVKLYDVHSCRPTMLN